MSSRWCSASWTACCPIHINERVAGSGQPESPNTTLGGRVFRYDGGTKWTDCGRLPDTEAVGGLVVYQGKLFASSLYKPAGFFRYEGGTKWTRLPDAQGPDPKTGVIANLSEDQFVARMRAGRILPGSPMPWQAYARMEEDDLRAIYRFLRSLPPYEHDTGPRMRTRDEKTG